MQLPLDVPLQTDHFERTHRSAHAERIDHLSEELQEGASELTELPRNVPRVGQQSSAGGIVSITLNSQRSENQLAAALLHTVV